MYYNLNFTFIKPKEVIQMEEFEKEMDIYTEEGVNCYCEDDEIDSREEGFMLGYLDAL